MKKNSIWQLLLRSTLAAIFLLETFFILGILKFCGEKNWKCKDTVLYLHFAKIKANKIENDSEIKYSSCKKCIYKCL